MYLIFEFSAIDSNNASTTVEEFLDTSHNTLDELWRLPYQYPQARMVDLMEIIGMDIVFFYLLAFAFNKKLYQRYDTAVL
mgnify:CR=1 FL=1